MDNLKPYDITIRLSKEQAYSLLRGLVSVNGQLLDTFSYDFPKVAPQVSMRVKIKEDKEEQFERVSGIKLVKPPSPKSHIEGMGNN